MDLISDVLERAADLIVEGGWSQGKWFSGTRCCVEGAIARARGSQFVRDSSDAAAFFASLLPKPPVGKRPLPFWNDANERTQPEVVQALREAASRARAQEQSK